MPGAICGSGATGSSGGRAISRMAPLDSSISIYYINVSSNPMYVALGPRYGVYAWGDLWFRRHRVIGRSGNFENGTIGFPDIDLLYQSVFKSYVRSVGAEIRRLALGRFPVLAPQGHREVGQFREWHHWIPRYRFTISKCLQILCT